MPGLGSENTRALLVLIFSLTIPGALPIRLKAEVPAYKLRGQSAVLECDYDMENETLYSVKWYKDDKEFFRFLPGENPSSQYFPTTGVDLDISSSTHRKLFINYLTFNSTGNYKCEISGESPSFLTSSYLSSLTVVALPDQAPRITGVKKLNYKIGEKISANCSSDFSKPEAKMQWLIDKREVPNSSLRFYPKEASSDGLERLTLGLHFRPTENRVQIKNRLNLICRASIIIPVTKGLQKNIIQPPSKSTVIIDTREAEIEIYKSSSSSTRHFLLFPSCITVFLMCL